jgi:caffeoyl-CoA O-methyltransferase
MPQRASRTIGIPPEAYAYVVEHGTGGWDPIADELHEVTVQRFEALSGMNIGLDQGRLLMWLVQLLDARAVVEVGTFTGMSALWLARGLADGGRLTCFDVNEEYVSVGRPFWERAGVADRIEVRIGPAADGLAALPEEPSVDFAFVDADKVNYQRYLDLLLPRLRPGGLLAFDNTLWRGRLLDESDHSDDTVALRAFNDGLAARDDAEALVLTIGDGVTLVRHPRR